MPIRIVSKKEGFWRCGVQHSTTPTIYPDDRFTPEQLAQLQAEPMLVVDVLPEEKPKAAKGAGAKKAAAQEQADKEPSADAGTADDNAAGGGQTSQGE